VQIYPTLQDGIQATVATLENGYYPIILANLRGSVPRAQWGNACANLKTWGTGCGWLNAAYGDAPGNITGDDMTPEQEAKLDAVAADLKAVVHALFYGTGTPNVDPSTNVTWGAIKGFAELYETRLKAIMPVGATGSLDLTPVLNVIAAFRAEVAVTSGDVATVKRLIEKDLAP
jgi:hypothetical protein